MRLSFLIDFETSLNIRNNVLPKFNIKVHEKF